MAHHEDSSVWNSSIDVDLHGNVIHEDEPIESKMPKRGLEIIHHICGIILRNLLCIVMEK